MGDEHWQFPSSYHDLKIEIRALRKIRPKAKPKNWKLEQMWSCDISTQSERRVRYKRVRCGTNL